MDLMGIFKKKLKVLELDYHSISKGENHIAKLFSSEINGILIRNLFSKEEISNLLTSLNQIKEFDSPHTGASIYPFPCSSAKYRLNFDDYFKDSNAFFNTYAQKYDVDFIQRSLELIQKLSLTEVKIVENESNSFLPGTFRFINDDPAKIGLTQTHIGIEYVKRCVEEGSYELLKNQIDIYKQFSFFTLLQRPIEGGDFTIFDFDYKNYNVISGDFICKSNGIKKKKLLYSKNRFKTAFLNPGDAFIFADYKTWHRVEPIQGSVNRITYGFWFGYDKLKKNIRIWS